MFPIPEKVKTLRKYVIHIEYSDGTKGDIDLSYLAGKGIFKSWDEGDLFEKVYLNKETFAVSWNEELELCSDSLYLKIKGITFEEWKSKKTSHASN